MCVFCVHVPHVQVHLKRRRDRDAEITVIIWHCFDQRCLPHICNMNLYLWELMRTRSRLHGKIPNACKKRAVKPPSSPIFELTPCGQNITGLEYHFALVIQFQVFPSCVIISDIRNKDELTGQTIVRVGLRVWGETLSKGTTSNQPHVISTFCFQHCTVWHVAGNTLFTYV